MKWSGRASCPAGVKLARGVKDKEHLHASACVQTARRMPMNRRSQRSLLPPSLFAVLTLAGNAVAQIPAAIATPEEVIVVTLHAEGAQLYECKAGSDRKLTKSRSPAGVARVAHRPRRPCVRASSNEIAHGRRRLEWGACSAQNRRVLTRLLQANGVGYGKAP
jgi:hypothetical protein